MLISCVALLVLFNAVELVHQVLLLIFCVLHGYLLLPSRPFLLFKANGCNWECVNAGE